MLDSLITSKTRIKLLLKFFLNTEATGYLRGLAEEYGESTNAIRLELNHLEESGLLRSKQEGGKKLYKANTGHPLFTDIHNIVLKHSGVTQIIDGIISKIGDVRKAWIAGSFAKGVDSDKIELIIMGKDMDKMYIASLVEKAEKLIQRKIIYHIIMLEQEMQYLSENHQVLLIWSTNDTNCFTK